VTIAGVIMNPDKNEKFTASLENCGFLSGDMIHVSKRNRIEEIKWMLITTSCQRSFLRISKTTFWKS
jgi:hypothetical protein